MLELLLWGCHALSMVEAMPEPDPGMRRVSEEAVGGKRVKGFPLSRLRTPGDRWGQANGAAHKQGPMLHVKQTWKVLVLYKYNFNYFYGLSLILTTIVLSGFKGMAHNSLKYTNMSFIWIWLVSTSSTGNKSNKRLQWESGSHLGNMTTDCGVYSQLRFYTCCPEVPWERDSEIGLGEQGVDWEREGSRTA